VRNQKKKETESTIPTLGGRKKASKIDEPFVEKKKKKQEASFLISPKKQRP